MTNSRDPLSRTFTVAAKQDKSWRDKGIGFDIHFLGMLRRSKKNFVIVKDRESGYSFEIADFDFVYGRGK